MIGNNLEPGEYPKYFIFLLAYERARDLSQDNEGVFKIGSSSKAAATFWTGGASWGVGEQSGENADEHLFEYSHLVCPLGMF